MSSGHGKKKKGKKKSPRGASPATIDEPLTEQIGNQQRASTQETKPQKAEDWTKLRWFHKPDPFDLAVWGLILTAAVAAIYIYQLRTMQEQLTEARKATEIQERPWLSLEATPVNGLIFVNGKEAGLALKFSVKNVGHSIAKTIQIDAKMFPGTAGMFFALDAIQRQRELCDHPAINQIGNFDLFPVDQPTVRELHLSVIPSEIEKQSVSIAGTKTRNFVSFYVVGCATYRSSFRPDFHQTRFSYHLMGPPAFDQDGKPLMANGMPIIGAFEVGIDVPKDKLGMWQELLGQNEAN